MHRREPSTQQLQTLSRLTQYLKTELKIETLIYYIVFEECETYRRDQRFNSFRMHTVVDTKRPASLKPSGAGCIKMKSND